jgi:hypothetical protein
MFIVMLTWRSSELLVGAVADAGDAGRRSRHFRVEVTHGDSEAEDAVERLDLRLDAEARGHVSGFDVRVTLAVVGDDNVRRGRPAAFAARCP